MFSDGGIVAVDHSGDDKEAIIEFFDFGSLVDIDDVFDDQGVELEHVCEATEGCFRAESDDIDPEAGASSGESVEFIDITNFFFDWFVS